MPENGHAAQQQKDLTEQIVAQRSRYEKKLSQLAAWSERKGLPERAAVCRKWVPRREADKIYLYLIDENPQSPPLSQEASENERLWQKYFMQVRQEHAAAIYDLAQQAAEVNQTSLALRLLSEVLREDPQHEAARKGFGYRKVDDQWVTPFAARMLQSGRIWHDTFGWIAKQDRQQYEQGMRRFGSRWIDPQQEQRLRSSMAKGWIIRTDNYQIRTNHSLEEGVRLATRFEQLHQVWRQLFADYFTTPQKVRQMFAGRPLPASRLTPYRVDYYRSRDEYNNALLKQQPQIGITLGIYFADQHRACFFAGKDQSAGTLYHEATHQLFQENRVEGSEKTIQAVGVENNFWIIEAIAVYLETLQLHSGYAVVGGDFTGRMPAARHRLLTDNYYVSFEELAQRGRADIQRDPQIARLYSQFAGQSAFLMHAGRGQYRSPLGKYLAAVYLGKAQPDTLQMLTGRSYSQLDKEYRQFMQAAAGGERNREREEKSP